MRADKMLRKQKLKELRNLKIKDRMKKMEIEERRKRKRNIKLNCQKYIYDRSIYIFLIL